jgi:hypothetical protein
MSKIKIRNLSQKYPVKRRRLSSFSERKHRFCSVLLSTKFFKSYDFRLLYYLSKQLSLFKINFDWDNSVKRSAAALKIQSIYRGMTTRKLIIPKLIQMVIRNRAAVVLQRSWRWHSSIGRRLRILSNISNACKRVTDETLYLDAWLFYLLIRHFKLPITNYNTRVFPEFRGIPNVNESGRISFSPFLKYFSVESYNQLNITNETSQNLFKLLQSNNYDNDIDDAIHAEDIKRNEYISGKGKPKPISPRTGKYRVGFPHWASWRPINGKEPIENKKTLR